MAALRVLRWALIFILRWERIIASQSNRAISNHFDITSVCEPIKIGWLVLPGLSFESFITKINNHGPNFVPWGTPLGTAPHSETQSLASFTGCFRPQTDEPVYNKIRDRQQANFIDQNWMINNIESLPTIQKENSQRISRAIDRPSPVV